MKPVTRRCAAWLACIAILFAALAPSISQALSTASSATQTEICSTGATKLVKVTAGKALHFQHCPFCATHAGSFALPPSASLAMPLPEARHSRPFLFYQSPRPLPIWTVAQSRAPPLSA